jgi:hypothetical protein
MRLLQSIQARLNQTKKSQKFPRIYRDSCSCYRNVHSRRRRCTLPVTVLVEYGSKVRGRVERGKSFSTDFSP